MFSKSRFSFQKISPSPHVLQLPSHSPIKRRSLFSFWIWVGSWPLWPMENGKSNALWTLQDGQLLPIALAIFTLREDSYHVRSPTTLRWPCHRGYLQTLWSPFTAESSHFLPWPRPRERRHLRSSRPDYPSAEYHWGTSVHNEEQTIVFLSPGNIPNQQNWWASKMVIWHG